MTIVSAYAIPGIKECYREYEDAHTKGQKIIEKVCLFYNLNELIVRSKRRDRRFVIARMFCMYFMYKNTALTLKEIGHIFNRDHTTVIHAREFISGQLSLNYYTSVKEDYEKLIQIV